MRQYEVTMLLTNAPIDSDDLTELRTIDAMYDRAALDDADLVLEDEPGRPMLTRAHVILDTSDALDAVTRAGAIVAAGRATVNEVVRASAARG